MRLINKISPLFLLSLIFSSAPSFSDELPEWMVKENQKCRAVPGRTLQQDEILIGYAKRVEPGQDTSVYYGSILKGNTFTPYSGPVQNPSLLLYSLFDPKKLKAQPAFLGYDPTSEACEWVLSIQGPVLSEIFIFASSPLQLDKPDPAAKKAFKEWTDQFSGEVSTRLLGTSDLNKNNKPEFWASGQFDKHDTGYKVFELNGDGLIEEIIIDSHPWLW